MYFDNLPKNHFKAILADPPWRYQNWSDKKQGAASAIYNTMSLCEIKAMPVSELASSDCLLFLWATYPKLPECIEVLEAWEFGYISVAFTWVKIRSNSFHKGLGFWTRGNPEIVLLGKKGNPIRKNKNIDNLVIAEMSRHSEKPEEVRRRIEELCDGPYLELFCRKPREGWTSWGNEVLPCQYMLKE